jgi:hypothetical protein
MLFSCYTLVRNLRHISDPETLHQAQEQVKILRHSDACRGSCPAQEQLPHAVSWPLNRLRKKGI